jgi:hypothetical protein
MTSLIGVLDNGGPELCLERNFSHFLSYTHNNEPSGSGLQMILSLVPDLEGRVD